MMSETGNEDQPEVEPEPEVQTELEGLLVFYSLKVLYFTYVTNNQVRSPKIGEFISCFGAWSQPLDLLLERISRELLLNTIK